MLCPGRLVQTPPLPLPGGAGCVEPGRAPICCAEPATSARTDEARAATTPRPKAYVRARWCMRRIVAPRVFTFQLYESAYGSSYYAFCMFSIIYYFHLGV